MPKATAVWLVENTALTFKQIADFCGLHELEVQGIADGEVGKGTVPVDPILLEQLTKQEILRCEKDPSAVLKLAKDYSLYNKSKAAKYVPIVRRYDKPDAAAWVIKHYPEMKDAEIAKLLGSTKTTVQAIRDKTHYRTSSIRLRDPVTLGLCTQTELDILCEKIKKRETPQV